ncbi:MAG: hypothetical protein LBR18_05705 [Tannerella sp.]|jgi:ribosomal 30S subunit maturation factor RimM|nr:hypothetical protein [Tannerella sp.]
MLKEKLIHIGNFGKAHGVNGEVTLHTSLDADMLDTAPFIACDLDDIPVPFFIKEIRRKNKTSVYVMLDNVESEKQAANLSGRDCFVPRNNTSVIANEVKQSQKQDNSIDCFVPRNDEKEEANEVKQSQKHYIVIDDITGLVGEVKYIDDTTANTLLVVEAKFGEVLIPAALIRSVSDEKGEIYVSLPDGLLQL